MSRVATQESTAAPGKETTAVPPGKTTNNMEKKKLLISNRVLSVINFLLSYKLSFMSATDVQLSLCQSFSFHAAAEESTAAPGEETTAAPPGKTHKQQQREKPKKY